MATDAGGIEAVRECSSFTLRPAGRGRRNDVKDQGIPACEIVHVPDSFAFRTGRNRWPPMDAQPLAFPFLIVELVVGRGLGRATHRPARRFWTNEPTTSQWSDFEHLV